MSNQTFTTNNGQTKRYSGKKYRYAAPTSPVRTALATEGPAAAATTEPTPASGNIIMNILKSIGTGIRTAAAKVVAAAKAVGSWVVGVARGIGRGTATVAGWVASTIRVTARWIWAGVTAVVRGIRTAVVWTFRGIMFVVGWVVKGAIALFMGLVAAPAAFLATTWLVLTADADTPAVTIVEVQAA